MSSDGSDKFVYEGDDFVVSQCAYCRHLLPGPAAVCSAFPSSIPAEILANDFDHRQPWIDPATGQVGDQGVALKGSILFEPKPAVPEPALDALYRVLDATH
jgi:hypothetical protein